MQEDKTIRLFIAIKLPSKIIDGLKKIQDELKNGNNMVAWVKPENIHLTIKFLGDISEDKVDLIAGLLKAAIAENRSFDISVKGLGVFPTMDNPRVVWVGVEDDKNLSRIYDELENGLSAIGFKKEERPFKPHLTIGRIKFLKDKKGFKQRLEKAASINLGKFEAANICIFQSKLTPDGAVYTKLKEATIK